MAELTPEKIDQLAQALGPLGQARYILTAQRRQLLAELARASLSLLRNADGSVVESKSMSADIFDLANGVTPETEYDAIEASLKASAERSRATMTAVDNERSNLVAVITSIVPALSDPDVDAAIKNTVGFVTMLDDLLTPKVEEPEG
jgi:hypothetical protein